MDKTSLLLGRLTGRQIAGQRAKKTPIAYLYNGVQLPPLPEWDKETYPYAFIGYNDDWDMYLLYYSTNQYKAMVPGGAVIIGDGGYGVMCDGNEWSKRNNTGLIHPVIVWANYDVYYTENTNLGELSGALYLSASDPIPVYA